MGSLTLDNVGWLAPPNKKKVPIVETGCWPAPSQPARKISIQFTMREIGTKCSKILGKAFRSFTF